MALPMIVLASTSRYRRELLARLRCPFDVQAPHVDETALPSEAPRETAVRLALDKAAAVAARLPGSIVIGSDQTVDVDGISLGKPMSHEAALAQLQSLQGRTAVFYTGLAVIGPKTNGVQVDCVSTTVKFKNLPKEKLEAYLHADQPYDCAGSARIEGLGIALVERVTNDDPSALIGLPLIQLTTMLDNEGIGIIR